MKFISLFYFSKIIKSHIQTRQKIDKESMKVHSHEIFYVKKLHNLKRYIRRLKFVQLLLVFNCKNMHCLPWNVHCGFSKQIFSKPVKQLVLSKTSKCQAKKKQIQDGLGITEVEPLPSALISLPKNPSVSEYKCSVLI